MEKRLNRSELVFSLAFLLMLVVAAGAFFFGVRVGTDRTEAKYETKEADAAASPALPNAYQQQDLVSFYHTVFLPYREFQKNWFDVQRDLLSDATMDRSAAMKQLTKSATKTYDKIKAVQVSAASPLLVDAQTSYLKSLKLFSDGFSALAKEKAKSGDDFLAALNANDYYKEGRIQALSGQDRYYHSMLKWASTVDLDIPADYEIPDILAIEKWRTLPLIVKIKASADYLSTLTDMKEFAPQDLTARIDDFIRSGQAERRKLKSVGAIAELLTSADGVRGGDFLRMKERFYGQEQLPQLPFFFSDN